MFGMIGMALAIGTTLFLIGAPDSIFTWLIIIAGCFVAGNPARIVREGLRGYNDVGV